MKLFTFKGGAHPNEGKALSENCGIRRLELPGEYVFPVSQHIGAPAKPLVAAGDRVLAGQKLAEAGGFISADVLSSVSGTVKAVEPRMQVSGFPVMSVVVENDGLYETAPGIGEKRDWQGLTKEEIRQIVRDAGIVGLGGAGFPTAVKLMPKNDEAIDYFIANGSECEPFLTSDYRMLMEEGERIVGGLEICLSLFPNAKGRYINSGMLPADAGCIVDNVATLAAIYDAVAMSTPLMEKVITITGDAVAEPANVQVRLGISYKAVLEACGGLKTEAKKLICGGPMMGQALFELDCPVTKPSSALCAFAHDEVAENLTTPCIRCGRCVEACPEFLVPPMMVKAATHDDLAGFEALNGMECMECGTCAYVCPARRPLTQIFKQARKMVMADRKIKAAEKKQREEHEAAAKREAEQKLAADKAAETV